MPNDAPPAARPRRRPGRPRREDRAGNAPERPALRRQGRPREAAADNTPERPAVRR